MIETTININDKKNSWSREEVIKLLEDYGYHLEQTYCDFRLIKSEDKWIEENLSEESQEIDLATLADQQEESKYQQ
jgi:hypothetical protein